MIRYGAAPEFARSSIVTNRAHVLLWTDNTGALNVGLFQVKGGITALYYFTIRP